MTCENCEAESRTTRVLRGLIVCQDCFNSLITDFNQKPVGPVTEGQTEWIPIDLWKLECYGAAAESGDWLGKYLMGKVNDPVQENNLFAWAQCLLQSVQIELSARTAKRSAVRIPTGVSAQTTNNGSKKSTPAPPTLDEIGDAF